MRSNIIITGFLVSLAFSAFAQMPGVDIRPTSGGLGTVRYSNDNMVSNFTPTVATKPIATGDWCFDGRRGSWYYYNGISWQLRGVNDGEAADVAYTTTNPASNIATGWDASLYNKMTVNLTTSGVDTMRIALPSNTATQTPGEIFVVDMNTTSRTGDADTLLLHFDSLFRTYDGHLLTEWKCPPRGRIQMAFRVHVSVEGNNWVAVDDILGSYGHSSGGGGGIDSTQANNGLMDSLNTIQLGNPTSVSNSVGRFFVDRYLNLNSKSFAIGDATNTLWRLFGNNDSLYSSLGGIRINLDNNPVWHFPGGGGGAGINENMGFGYSALQTMVGNGYANTAIGRRSLFALNAAWPDASSNTAIGYGAMESVTTGSLNSIVGAAALQSGADPDGNSGIGHHAMQAITGDNNVGVGREAMGIATSGDNNVAVGTNALYKSQASNNTGIGYSALQENLTGTENTAIGYGALQSNTASENTVVGFQSVQTGATGGFNVAVGNRVMPGCTTCNTNTGIGRRSLTNLTTGNGNTALGKGAGTTLSTGSSNIYIGLDANASSSSVSNEVNIGNSLFATSINALTSKWGVNASAPAQTFEAKTWTGSTNSVTAPIRATTEVSGASGAVGIGSEIELAAENGSGTDVVYAALRTVSTDVTAGSEDGYLLGRSMLNGTLTTLWTATHTQFTAKNYVFNVDQTVGAAQNGYSLKYNSGSGEIELTAPADTVYITLTPLSFSDSVKTIQELGKAFWNVPSNLNGYTISKVEYAVIAAGSGTGSVTCALKAYNSTRGVTYTNGFAQSFSSGDYIKTASPGTTVVTGQLLVPQITTDTIVTHPRGLSVLIMLTK